jgi:parvulin-like peptidyl-prolyl isomerase
MYKRAALMVLVSLAGLAGLNAQDAKDAKDAQGAQNTEAQAAQAMQASQAKGQRVPMRPPGATIRPGGPGMPGRPGAPDLDAPEVTKDPEEPLFRIGDKIYREKDFVDYLPFIMPPSRVDQAKRDERMLAEARKAYADQMLLMSQALKDGVDKSREHQDRLAGLAKYLLADEARKRLPAMDSVQPTDEEMEAYYEQNAASYRVEERASARHILARVLPKDGEAKALDTLKKAAKDLKGGKGWPEVAKKYSDDPASKDRGGLIENFDPARMAPEFAAVVRTQEKGELGPPIRSPQGYHIVQVESLSPARTMTFDEAKQRVRGQVSSKMLQDARAAYMESLRAELGFSDTDFEAPEPEPPPAKGNKLRAHPLPPNPPKKAGGTAGR